MQSHRQHEDHGHDDGDDVEGDHGVRPLVPALEHGGVTELHQEDVDDTHGTQEQGLYCDWKTEKYGGGQVTDHTRYENVVREGTPSVPGMILDLGTRLGSTGCDLLSQTGELNSNRSEGRGGGLSCNQTYHIDLSHGVDENYGEDCNCQS